MKNKMTDLGGKTSSSQYVALYLIASVTDQDKSGAISMPNYTLIINTPYENLPPGDPRYCQDMLRTADPDIYKSFRRVITQDKASDVKLAALVHYGQQVSGVIWGDNDPPPWPDQNTIRAIVAALP
jgi:hypothetical protein